MAVSNLQAIQRGGGIHVNVDRGIHVFVEDSVRDTTVRYKPKDLNPSSATQTSS